MKIKAFSILETVFGLVIIALIVRIIATIFSFFIQQLEIIKEQNSWNFENEKLHFIVNKANHENNIFKYNDNCWTWVNSYKNDSTKLMFSDSIVVFKKNQISDSLKINIHTKFCDSLLNKNRKGYIRLNLVSIDKLDTIKMKWYMTIFPNQDINKLSSNLKNGN